MELVAISKSNGVNYYVYLTLNEDIFEVYASIDLLSVITIKVLRKNGRAQIDDKNL
jgi:hypothetical protein